MNVRSVLEYVPYFRGRVFLVHIDASLLGADELVDALLDADALHEIGVRLVLVAEGSETALLAHRAGACEMHAAVVEMPLTDGEPAIARVREILERGQVAIVPSGTTGRFAEPAVALALALQASKYICLQRGEVPRRQGQPLFAISATEVASCGDCTNLPLLLQAAAICRRGIPRVHMLDGLYRGVMLDEIFSEEGVGTMVHSDSYREIRPLQEEDIPELLSMIARCMADAKLVNRTYEDVRKDLHSYYVYTLDDTIVGCVAIYPTRRTPVRSSAAFSSRSTTRATAMAAPCAALWRTRPAKWVSTASLPSLRAPWITSATASTTPHSRVKSCPPPASASWRKAAAPPRFSAGFGCVSQGLPHMLEKDRRASAPPVTHL